VSRLLPCVPPLLVELEDPDPKILHMPSCMFSDKIILKKLSQAIWFCSYHIISYHNHSQETLSQAIWFSSYHITTRNKSKTPQECAMMHGDQGERAHLTLQ